MHKGETDIIPVVLGCKVNYADAQAALAQIDEEPGAAVALVSTCCVTAEGERQSRKEVRRALRRVGAAGKVYVSGCALRRDPEGFLNMAPNVIAITDVEQAPRAQRALSEKAAQTGGHGRRAQRVTNGLRPARSRYFLKVQDGCATRCSYCVIPAVRGKPASVPLEAAVAEARDAIAMGYCELVVTGINLGAWRGSGRRLAHLVGELAALDGLKRLRISSIEIGHIDEAMMRVIADHEIIGRHLHVPLQSADDGVLRDMGRRYSAAEFSDRMEKLRESIPGINLTTDVIVGFPTETRAAFESTVAFVESNALSKVHVFSYSARPGTAAERFGDDVPVHEKKRRSAILRELSDRLQKDHRQRKVGHTSEVLLESGVAGDSVMRGYSSDYTRFVVRGSDMAPGLLVEVTATAVSGAGVVGTMPNGEGTPMDERGREGWEAH